MMTEGLPGTDNNNGKKNFPLLKKIDSKLIPVKQNPCHIGGLWEVMDE